MKKLWIIGLLLMSSLCATMTYTYETNVTNNRFQEKVVVKKTDAGYEFNFQGVDIYTDNHFKALKQVIKQKEAGTDVVLTRAGNNIQVNGTMNGKQIEAEIKIDERPWYANYLSFKEFVLSDRKEQVYFMPMISEKGQSAMRMKLIKENKEPIIINGEKIFAQKIRITIDDWRSFMWSSYVWFNKEAVLVKTEELRGPPGSPLYRMELIRVN